MTAKEMFEKLGYKRIETMGMGFKKIIYGKRFEECIDTYGEIKFDLVSEIIRFNNVELTVKDIQAIAQQMKELGWLN